ncbi:MAG: DUF4743 domain-containing protein [Gammaproteobacteria bacterium]|nr:DUF4743 domain-containing protein [Gammaproteobacteria bacterium]
MSYQQRIAACNGWNRENFIPWLIKQQIVGWVKHPFAAALAPFATIFHAHADRLELNPALDNFARRTSALAEVTAQLAADGWFALQDEPFAVKNSFTDAPLMTLDRAAATHFGIRAWGQHLNGYLRQKDHYQLWIARRAKDRYHFPDMLDNMVAGGLPYGISLEENIAKECFEEAAIPADLAARARICGAVTYIKETARGLKIDTMFCYDLELPTTFTPICTDGEVDSFTLMSAGDVATIVHDSEQFKPNCNLVIIDFLIRHGLLTPAEPGYSELLTALHPSLTLSGTT